MVRGVVAADGVDERRVAHEPVVAHMAAIVEGLVNEVLPDNRDHQDVAGVRVHRGAERERERRAHAHEGEEGAPREEDDAPFAGRAYGHLVVGEVLVVLARVPVIDRAQRPDVDQAVHHVLVHPPFEQVGEEEHRDHEQPFPARTLQPRYAPGDDREADCPIAAVPLLEAVA